MDFRELGSADRFSQPMDTQTMKSLKSLPVDQQVEVINQHNLEGRYILILKKGDVLVSARIYESGFKYAWACLRACFSEGITYLTGKEALKEIRSSHKLEPISATSSLPTRRVSSSASSALPKTEKEPSPDLVINEDVENK